jgi:hypothetical protein
MPGEFECRDPLAVIDLDFVIGGAVFPEPGEYRVQLIVAGETIIERRLLVIDPKSLAPETPSEPST